MKTDQILKWVATGILIVGSLVNGFSSLVGFISGTINKMKEFVNYIKNNPVTNFFFGGDNSKGLKASTSFDTGGGGGSQKRKMNIGTT